MFQPALIINKILSLGILFCDASFCKICTVNATHSVPFIVETQIKRCIKKYAKSIYTELQKKHHFFRTTVTKILSIKN